VVRFTGETTPTYDAPVVRLTGDTTATPPTYTHEETRLAQYDRGVPTAPAETQVDRWLATTTPSRPVTEATPADSRFVQPTTADAFGGDIPLVQLTGETGRNVPLNYGTLTDQFVGSEQATLGVTYQALADWGLLTSEEMGFLGVQPAALPAWALGMQDLGILQNNLAAAGIDPNVVWEIYNQTTINDRDYAVLKDYSAETGLDGGGYSAYDGGDDGDGGGGYTYRAPSAGYSPYRAPGTFQSGYTSGLINWRIGF